MEGLADLFSPGGWGVGTQLPAAANSDATPGLARSAINVVEHPLSKNNGLMVAGIVIAATFGLIAVSSSARIGTARVGASVGSP